MTKQRHFSMIRDFHLADFFTLANAACGVAGVFFAMQYVASQAVADFLAAAALAPAAFIFDVLDGRVARWRHTHSALGRELDSLADVISFGVAPAALGFAAGLRGGWDWVVLIYFVCCGVGRLARFNVTAEQLSEGTGKVAYFRRHADSDQRPTLRRTRLRRLAGPARAGPVGRHVDSRPGGPASTCPVVRAVRHADDQQDAAHSEALAMPAQITSTESWRQTRCSERSILSSRRAY